MSVAASDLKWYGSANMPESDSTTGGGAIDTTVMVVPDSSTLFNTPGQTLEMVSSNVADTMNVTITGRLSTGIISSETKALNGTTVVSFTPSWERIEKIVFASSAAGTVTVRLADDTPIVAIPTGITSVRRLFYGASANPTGGASKDIYEKIFLKNTNASLALLGAAIAEQADPGSNITFALAGTINDSVTIANRLTAPAGGLTFDSSAKNVIGTDLAPGDRQGVWLKLTLAAGAAAAKTTYTVRTTGSSI